MSEHKKASLPKKKDNVPESIQLKEMPLMEGSHHTAIIQRAKINPQSLTRADVIQLQKTIGNRAVVQLFNEIGTANSNSKPVKQEELAHAEKIQESEPVQKKENKTGMPDNLKAGVESLSGIDMSDVRVHYNSSKPAQVGALAYTQGTDIHVAPGQEKHLPHEGWHVVQQKQGRVTATTQIAGVANINDDAALEREADVIGAKALEINSGQDADSGRNQATASSNTIQRMIDWGELVGTLGPYIYYAISALGIYAFYKIINWCFSKGKKSKEEMQEALDEAIRNKESKSDESEDKESHSQEDPGNESFTKEEASEDLAEELTQVDSEDEELQSQLEPSTESLSKKEASQKVVEELQQVESQDKEQQQQAGTSTISLIKKEAPEKVAEELTQAVDSGKSGSKEESGDKQEASSRGQSYLEALRNTNMWGGYAEANAIATNYGFSSRIFGRRNGGDRLQLLANIGNGPQRSLSLFWDGGHYQVIDGNPNDGDAVPEIEHDPVGDGNCLFEAMFFILRDGGDHVRGLLGDNTRRGLEVRNMRATAARVLSEGDPALLNYLGEEYHQAKEKKNDKWKNASDSILIGRLMLYEKLLMTAYKMYPPKDYYILSEKKNSFFVGRKDETNKISVSIFLRDHKEIKEILLGEKNSTACRAEFKDWLLNDAAYQKEISKKEDTEKLPKGHDGHSFKIADSAGILSFLESKAASSMNLVNCSQHLDGGGNRSNMQFDELPVYHYSRGREDWGQQYSVFYVLLNGTYVKIIGIGSHVGGGAASYKLEWGIGQGDWVKGYEFSL